MKHCEDVEISETFNELVDRIQKRANFRKITEKAIENRERFADKARKFHEEAGTLTNLVRENIEYLKKGEDCFFLLSAHQPNLMPYSGMVRKLTLMEAVTRRLKTIHSIPSTINLHSISDQAFPDRWVKTAQLPNVLRREGYIDINNPEIKKKPHNRLTGYGKYGIRIDSIPKPSSETMSMWREKIESWVHNNLKATKKLARKYGCQVLDEHCEMLFKNARDFLDILNESYKRAKNYADFNAFILSKIVNDSFGYGTLFVRYSESKDIVKDEVSSLSLNYKKYFTALKEAKWRTRATIIDMQLAPFWYHCRCGGMVNLLVHNSKSTSYCEGKCTNCEKSYRFDISFITSEKINFFSHVSLRSIPFLLIYSEGLRPDLYVGGVGGMKDYYPEAKIVADRLEIEWPVIGIWNPQDYYAGIGQLHAFLLFKRNTSSKVSRRITQALYGRYSIADYAMNIGLEETSQQWLDHLLTEDGKTDLTSDVYMNSLFDGKLTKHFFEFAQKKIAVSNPELNQVGKYEISNQLEYK